MNNENLVYSHTAYFNILKTRGMQGLQKDMPLWKFKLSEEEVTTQHPYRKLLVNKA